MNNTILPDAFPADAITFTTAGNNGTLISIILDESGSMISCLNPTIEGFNEYVSGQRNSPEAGQVYMSLTKFDAPNIKIEYVNKPISEVPELSRHNYKPNGGTNLFDAIGNTINNVEGVLSKIPEQAQRPAVIVVIMTDGHENSSREYSANTIKKMVSAAESAEWLFLFIGANIDSFAAGSAIGMTVANTASYDVNDTKGMYASLNNSTTAMRSAKMAGTSTASVYASGAAVSGFANKGE